MTLQECASGGQAVTDDIEQFLAKRDRKTALCHVPDVLECTKSGEPRRANHGSTIHPELLAS